MTEDDIAKTEKLVEIMEKRKKKKVLSNLAKNTTLAMLIIVFIIGIGGSFEFLNYNMEKLKIFLEAFVPFYAVLIVSIGTNSAIDKIKKEKDE
jgi:hypothetical protein